MVKELLMNKIDKINIIINCKCGVATRIENYSHFNPIEGFRMKKLVDIWTKKELKNVLLKCGDIVVEMYYNHHLKNLLKQSDKEIFRLNKPKLKTNKKLDAEWKRRIDVEALWKTQRKNRSK